MPEFPHGGGGGPETDPIAVPEIAAEETRAKAVEGNKQPLDSDLTALAALSSTSFGRTFIELADAAAARTKLGLGTAATTAASAYDAAGAAAAAQGASQPLDSDLTALAALTSTAFGRTFIELADAAAARTKLGLGTAATTSSGAYDASGAATAAQAASAPLVHATRHMLGGEDAVTLPQYDLFDLLPYTVPMEMYPGTTQTPIAARTYLVRFTVSKKRVFRFLRWPVGVVGTGTEDKVDGGIYQVTGAAKLTRLGSSGAIKTNFTTLGVKANEFTANVTCEPGIAYFCALTQEVVTGTPQVLALLNNNGSVGDMVGTGSFANRLMLIKNATFPLPEEITSVTSSAPVTYMVPSEV